MNDNAPQFETNIYQLSVSEDALSEEGGALVLTHLKVRDPDMGSGGHVKYELVGEKVRGYYSRKVHSILIFLDRDPSQSTHTPAHCC